MYKTLIKPALLDAKNFVLDTLFPITCLACGVEGELICADCKVTMKTLENQRCIVCQKPTPFGLTHKLCQTMWGADGLISFYDYHDEKVSQTLIKGKYSFLPGAYVLLGQMMAKKIKAEHNLLLTTPYTLTPIPLHFTRKRWRGFNQAEILCQTLSKELNWPVEHLLIRNKLTKTQKDLKKEQRLKNIQNAFALNPQSVIRNKQLLLIDDVTTTGATLQQAAQILKRAGAKKVMCLTVARD